MHTNVTHVTRVTLGTQVYITHLTQITHAHAHAHPMYALTLTCIDHEKQLIELVGLKSRSLILKNM